MPQLHRFKAIIEFIYRQNMVRQLRLRGKRALKDAIQDLSQVEVSIRKTAFELFLSHVISHSITKSYLQLIM